MKEEKCFIDMHCHLELCSSIEGVIERAREANVGIIIANGVNLEANRKVLEISSKYDEVKAALGFYPTDALKINDAEIEKEIEFIRKNKDKIKAIGEIGLDFKEDTKNKERQIEIFKKFIALSIELDKPIFIHSRKAEKEAVEILEKIGAKKVIMHCFSGSFSLIKRIVENEWFLTIPTNVKFSEHFQKMAEEVQLDRLFCETDSPFLHPDKLRNNEPALVVESYKKIAEIKKLSLDYVKVEIYKNYIKLFN